MYHGFDGYNIIEQYKIMRLKSTSARIEARVLKSFDVIVALWCSVILKSSLARIFYFLRMWASKGPLSPVLKSMLFLITSTVTDLRNIIILLGHWGMHAYGIVALTELKDPIFHLSLIGLVPLPAVFYILTARFTDPNKLHTD